MKVYTAKEMSKRTGLSIPTLHYYERINLLEAVDRAANGHRRYSEEDLHRVVFLKRMRCTGMPIAMIQRYIELYRQGRSTLVQRRRILEAHRSNIMSQMNELQDTLDFIDYKLDMYYSDRDCADGAKEA